MSVGTAITITPSIPTSIPDSQFHITHRTVTSCDGYFRSAQHLTLPKIFPCITLQDTDDSTGASRCDVMCAGTSNATVPSAPQRKSFRTRCAALSTSSWYCCSASATIKLSPTALEMTEYGTNNFCTLPIQLSITVIGQEMKVN